MAVDEPEPLTPDQRRAATLMGQGWSRTDVAKEIGPHPETISRWSKREDFQQVAEAARRALLAQEPDAVSVLEQALSATHADGSPYWRIRIDAARTLVGRKGAGGGAAPPKVRETIIYLNPDDDEDDGNPDEQAG